MCPQRRAQAAARPFKCDNILYHTLKLEGPANERHRLRQTRNHGGHRTHPLSGKPASARVPSNRRREPIRGIDGRLYFHDEGKGGKTKQIIFSVKAGKVTVSHIRDLAGVINREKAEIGAFLSLEPPTSPMRKRSSLSGFLRVSLGKASAHSVAHD